RSKARPDPQPRSPVNRKRRSISWQNRTTATRFHRRLLRRKLEVVALFPDAQVKIIESPANIGIRLENSPEDERDAVYDIKVSCVINRHKASLGWNQLRHGKDELDQRLLKDGNRNKRAEQEHSQPEHAQPEPVRELPAARKRAEPPRSLHNDNLAGKLKPD